MPSVIIVKQGRLRLNESFIRFIQKHFNVAKLLRWIGFYLVFLFVGGDWDGIWTICSASIFFIRTFIKPDGTHCWHFIKYSCPKSNIYLKVNERFLIRLPSNSNIFDYHFHRWIIECFCLTSRIDTIKQVIAVLSQAKNTPASNWLMNFHEINKMKIYVCTTPNVIRFFFILYIQFGRC